jgi:DNA helicase-2/ATP-dependent DNA helicase PcrA
MPPSVSVEHPSTSPDSRARANEDENADPPASSERSGEQSRERRLEGLLEGLNEPQRAAVTHGEGPLLILAGAGSGKTRVLTHRLAYLIFSGQAKPSEILAITFTNKAAGEMRTRVERLLGRSTRGMWISTFHSACARILRAQAPRLGYTAQFTIYDQADARRLAKRSMQELGVDPKRYTPATVHNRISQAKNVLLAAEEYRSVGGGELEATVADVYELYERDLRRSNAMDFDDLLLLTVRALERFPELREHYSESFRHVLVDEYQDTNHAQYRLLHMLCGLGAEAAEALVGAGGSGEAQHEVARGHRNLAVVGDDAQSVYGFRGADIRNILDFQQDFPDATVVKLEQNYRSTGTILRAANAIIANNRGSMPKELWSELGEGSPVHVSELDDEHAEARFVVGEIERLLDTGAARSEVAVFYRTNAMSRVIEDTLVRRDIAYQVIGGAKFYERAEIKDAVAYLSLLVNPHDAVSFGRIANSPRRGIGQTSLARIFAHGASTDQSVWDVAATPELIPGLTRAAANALAGFMETMSELRELAGGGAEVAELLASVLERTGYVAALEAEGTIEAEGRLENLEQLVAVAHEFDEAAAVGEGTLDSFLQEVALSTSADEDDGPGGDREDAGRGVVTLMTLHNAKGTEFPIVFIVGCEDGVIPHSRALDEGVGGLEEERRLFYVGVTRAMRELYLSYARRRAIFGAGTYGQRSRFLDEIPAELTQQERQPASGVGATLGYGGVSGPWQAPGYAGGVLGGRGPSERWDVGSGGAPAAGDGAGPRFRVGEDVVHATFGEGVVTAVEPGGVLIVRFAGDGSERTLLAEYANLERA